VVAQSVAAAEWSRRRHALSQRLQEYDESRYAADRINEKLHDLDPETYEGKHIHEIHPIKFGGSPTDLTNKIALSPKDHYAVNVWWRQLQRHVQTGKAMPGKDQ
jgi:hypothetical protein